MGLWILQVVTWANVGLKHTFPYAVLVMVSCAIVFFPSTIADCKEVEIRWIGLIFQIVGILVVLWQLDERLKRFRKPSFLARIRNHFRRFPSRHTKNINLSVHFSGEATGSARIGVRRKANSSIEGRIEALEGEMEDLKREVTAVEETLNRHKEDNRNSLETMREENRKKHESLKRLMDEAVVGGINLEWVGIWYLLVGIVLATAAPEIAVFGGYGGQCNQ